MRTAIACLVILFPMLALAADLPKDKYICNCHITPGIPWRAGPEPIKKAVVHHRKAKLNAQKSDATPAPIHKKTHIMPTEPIETETPASEGYPGREGIVPSNKLALPAGKSIYASGELVYISGRVLDAKCVPVSDAIVDIWQADPEGHYVHSTLGERLSPAPAFAGSGRATTDNLGRFNFVTVFPGSVGTRAPFIHVHVVHKDFPTLDTEMFFADDRRNATDPVFSSLSSAQRSMVTAKVWLRDPSDPDKGLGASWDISLNGKNPWRHF